MKILFLSNGYPPQRWAGTETYTAGIADELSRRGYDLQVLCIGSWEAGPSYWNGVSDDQYHSIPVQRINVNWSKLQDPFTQLYNNPIIADYLAQYIKAIRPDLVHITSCETLSASILRVVKDARIPSVLSLTDFWFLCPRIQLLTSDGANCEGVTTAWQCLRCQLLNQKVYQWPRKILSDENVSRLLMGASRYPAITRQRGFRGYAGNMEQRKDFLAQAYTWPDVRITASEFVKNIFRLNAYNAPVKVIPYGHDLTWLKYYKGKKFSECLRIGYIGQISEYKGVHTLIQAVNNLDQKDKAKVSLSIYGDLDHNPEYSATLHKLAENREGIKFCGTYRHDGSADIFSNLDILVVPSLWYDFPLIIFEALATQTPVIATDLGSMSESVIHEKNGLLFKRGDDQDLSKQLSRLINEPGLLDQLTQANSSVKSIQSYVDELEQIFQQIK